MRSGYDFEGTAVFVVGDWGYIVFLAAADRELASSPAHFPFVDSYNSSDDPTCLRNVESIQENPRLSLVHLCAGNHLLHCLGMCLQQSERGRLRYVSSSIGSPNAIQSTNSTLSRFFQWSNLNFLITQVATTCSKYHPRRQIEQFPDLFSGLC